MLPIPGASLAPAPRDDITGAHLKLSDEQFDQLAWSYGTNRLRPTEHRWGGVRTAKAVVKGASRVFLLDKGGLTTMASGGYQDGPARGGGAFCNGSKSTRRYQRYVMEK